MLQVKSQEASPTILHGDCAIEWYEITSRELKIATRQNDETHDINLEISQVGRKTPLILLTLASITLPETVTAKYADEPDLEKTVVDFAMEQYRDKVAMISQLMNTAIESRQLIDLTPIEPVVVEFAVKVERDDSDEVISEAVVATVGEQTFIYSNAGVFDVGA